MTPCDLLCTLLLLFVCVLSSVDGQKKSKPPRWKPKSRPFNGDNIIAKSSGSDIKLSCPAYGHPKPVTTWYKDQSMFDPSKRPKTKARHSSLILNNVQVSDKGEYKCVVRNTEGAINFTFIVDVIRTSWPLVLEEPQNATVTEGGKVVFRCRALNDPDATTQWIKRDSEVDDPSISNRDFLPSNGPEIVIENITVEDAGKYTCMVGNYFGIKHVDVWLTVKQLTTTTEKTTTTTTTTTTTPAPTTTTTTTTTTPRPSTTTTPVVPYIDYLPGIRDDEDMVEGSGSNMEKEKKKNKKKKKKNKKKKKKNKKKKKKDRQRERERKQQQREKKRQEELDRMNKEGATDREFPDREFPDISFTNNNNPVLFENNEDHFIEPIFPFLSTTPLPEDNKISTSKNPFRDFEPGAAEQEEEGMSAWTIYIIVGLVAGGVLLVGLVAIVVALCCNRIEDQNGYKHTSV